MRRQEWWTWKWVVGYEGYYQVAGWGDVRSVDRVVVDKRGDIKELKGRILRPRALSRQGYLAVDLSKEGVRQTRTVHRLVAEAFIGPCPPGQQVRHGPYGITDNTIENLCYGTPEDQWADRIRDGTNTNKPVRRSDGEEFRSLSEAARQTSCDVSSISNVCKGKAKTTGGFGWTYICQK